jgi:hypothetical protein
LTRESYAGVKPKLIVFSPARDALNPNVNVAALKNRLWTIDHYKFRYGADHTYWVHAGLRRLANNVGKYKFNYIVKAFLAYQAYRQYSNYTYI